MSLMVILSFVVTTIISALMIPLVIKAGNQLGIVAHMNKRTVHKHEIARIGVDEALLFIAKQNVLKDKNYEIEKAYIFSEGNVETKGQKIYMPIYMIMFLKNTELKNTIYKIDLSGL